MSNRLKIFYHHNVIYDLIQKLHFLNFFKIPSINKIYLNLTNTNFHLEKKKIIFIFLIMDLIANNNCISVRSKKNKIKFKIKKGTIVGCKTVLNQKKSYIFIEKLLLFIMPNMKNFKGIVWKSNNINNISFKITNILNFLELENEFLKVKKFNLIVDVTLKLKSNKTLYSQLLLNSFNFPIKNH